MKRCILLLLLISQVAAMNVSIVLDDNVTVQNYTVTHMVRAFRDVENVSILDYYPKGVTLKDIPLKEEDFGGSMMNAARLNVGNLSANQVAIVAYQMLDGGGDALMGADIYYLEGERHQLYPKTITLKAKKRTLSSANRFLVFPFLTILLILVLMYFKQRHRGSDLY